MKKVIKNVAKNTGGVCLIIIGCMLIFTPGPGLLTILAGLYITSFPGKPFLVAKLKKTKFYNRYVINIESKIKSKFKRKNKYFITFLHTRRVHNLLVCRKVMKYLYAQATLILLIKTWARLVWASLVSQGMTFWLIK